MFALHTRKIFVTIEFSGGRICTAFEQGRLMPRAPGTFKQCDVTKALKAAVKAGLEVSRYEIDRSGKIVIITVKPDFSGVSG